MGSSRFTVKDLREAVAEYNDRLLEEGAKKQFRVWPRNGHQAVDEYSCDDSGMLLKCSHNVGLGTSREVNAACDARYLQIIAALS